MLVIFDCDGVLVDSEPIANTCFARALQREGLNWSVEETMRRLMGRSMKSCVEIIEGELGRALPTDFVDRLQADTMQAFQDAPLCAVPGVIAAIDAIEAAGAVTCVASSGGFGKMRVTLGITGLWQRFEGRSSVPAKCRAESRSLISSCMQPFAWSSSRFACTVVEDSLPGIRGARALRACASWPMSARRILMPRH